MKQNYNNNSLARLGHGKWKSALGHTLLIIGMVLMSLGVYAQTQTNPEMTMPDGLVMKKTWVPDDYTGHSGNILVETYVTGHSDAIHVPADIVLVLDVSGSMNDRLYEARESQAYSYSSYGNNTYYYLHTDGNYYAVNRRQSGGRCYLRFQASNGYYNQWWYLYGSTATTQEQGVSGQNTTIYTGVLYEQGQTKMAALKTSVKDFVDIIARDGSQYNVNHTISIVKYASAYYYPNNSTGEPLLTEGNHRGAGYNNNYNYTEVLIDRRDPNVTPQGSTVQNDTYIKNQVDALNAGGATSSDYGMSKARYVLAATMSSQEERKKVVVMFTDGVPTHGSDYDATVAEATITNSHNLKNSWTNGGTTYNFNATVYTVGVFDQETATIRTYMNRVSSNYPDATGMDDGEGGTQQSNKYYFKAETAGSLSDIFKAIAGDSGALVLPTGTIVQDVVSPSFHLPNGASTNITAYAPKFTGIVNGEYKFEDLNDAGTLQLTNGVVNDLGAENKLPSNFITINGSQIQMQGFDFSEQWCGYIGTDTPNGRKVVIKIPVTINEGLWGDGMQTNDPKNSYIYNPTTGEYYGPFNNLTADVQGDVWTEIVTTQPSTFDDTQDPIEIGSPEDLAWFISWVNGRQNYTTNNGISSHWDANAILTADIDMSAHNWVPIGSGVGHNVGGYIGTFNGNGHVITGLKNNASKYYKMETTTHPDGVAVVFPGMFSKVGDGGVVKNVFVLDTDFRGKHHSSDFVHHGIIADTLLAGGTIFNCEAAGRLTCNNDEPNQDKNLVFGGLVGLNQGTIHSCMAMAELTGYTLGGMIGENGKNGTNGSFSNGFTNGVYNYLGSDNTYKVGGIAGINPGTIDNCYVRFERNNSGLDKAGFGMLVGSGTEPTNSYIPQIVTWSRPDYMSFTSEITTNLTVPHGSVLHPADNPSNSYILTMSPSFWRMCTNDNMTGGSWGTLTDQGVTYNVYQNGTPLLTKLNNGKGDGASWKRTTAGRFEDDKAVGTTPPQGFVTEGDINDDYPVLAFEKFSDEEDAPMVTCLGSADGIRIDYATSLDEMLDRHNNYTVNTNSTWNNNKYKNKQVDAIKGGAINLYANDNTSRSTSSAAGTVVYIDEVVSLLQDVNSSIEAYTGQTLKSFVRTDNKERWHFVSSSLEDSEFGWDYGTSEDVGFNWEQDPCELGLAQEDEDHAFFPIDLRSYSRMDFYCFNEPYYHWINFKRNSASHYHMDADQNGNHASIPYTNETSFKPGKGYLVSIDVAPWASYNKHAQFVQNRGTLNNGTFTYSETVSHTAANEWTGLAGYNLLGNPYQSYLDFTTFAWENSSLWNDASEMTFAIYDPKTDSYVQGMAGDQPSQGAMASTGDINMHQGFLVRVSNSGNAVFNNNMRRNTPADGTHFRGERPAYPLINFILNDSKDNTDIAVLELNRPENSGALKLRAGNPEGRIYFRHDNTNMAIFFRDNANGYQSLNFAAEEDGNFTLNWNTANADFSRLTLVDNITGIKTDMLTHDHYTFEGRVDDYNTRFKIVFGEMDNNEEEPVLEHFAFFDHGNLIVNGTGHFEVVDVLGRTVYSAELTDTQNTISLPSNVRGVCMLCFTRNNETKVQKMVIQ